MSLLNLKNLQIKISKHKYFRWMLFPSNMNRYLNIQHVAVKHTRCQSWVKAFQNWLFAPRMHKINKCSLVMQNDFFELRNIFKYRINKQEPLGMYRWYFEQREHLDNVNTHMYHQIRIDTHWGHHCRQHYVLVLPSLDSVSFRRWSVHQLQAGPNGYPIPVRCPTFFDSRSDPIEFWKSAGIG